MATRGSPQGTSFRRQCILVSREDVDRDANIAGSGGSHGEQAYRLGVATSLADECAGVGFIADDFQVVEAVTLSSVDDDVIWRVNE